MNNRVLLSLVAATLFALAAIFDGRENTLAADHRPYYLFTAFR